MPYAEEQGLYDDIFKNLSTLYKPVTEDKQALYIKNALKDNPEEATQDMEAFLIIEQIMVGLKGHIGVTKDVVNDLLKYTAQFRFTELCRYLSLPSGCLSRCLSLLSQK